MISINKLKTIAKAQFSNKENLGDWYATRLDICSKCLNNSTNKESLTVKEKAMVAFNRGKDTCLACGCGIAAKASVRGSECGLVERGEEPIWGALPEITSLKSDTIKLDNLSADKVVMLDGEEVMLNYGDIKYESDSEIQISIKDTKEDILELKAFASCGCTVPSPYKKGDTHYVKIKYDTKRLGVFKKDITFHIVRPSGTVRLKIKITGTVKN